MAFLGIQVYEILENGNLLNAVYTNTGLLTELPDDTHHYVIDSEIARKKPYDDTKEPYDNTGVGGFYDCRYIQTNNVQTNDLSVISCELKISKHDGVYEFTWKGAKANWKGLGLMAGTTHIAVSYEEA